MSRAETAPRSDQGGDKDAALFNHLPIVRTIARQIHRRLPRSVDIEDLTSAGTVGLLEAISRFEPGRKIRFDSFAQYRIRGAILDSLRDIDWAPRTLRRKAREIEEVSHALRGRLERPPSEEEIAEKMELSLAEYQKLQCEIKCLEIGSLFTRQTYESAEEEEADLPSRPEDDPLLYAQREETRSRLRDLVKQLPARQRLVIFLYYNQEMTQREIAIVLGTCESRICQMHRSALARLRQEARSRMAHSLFTPRDTEHVPCRPS
jgi:RNA polymerase sigma factor FliA